MMSEELIPTMRARLVEEIAKVVVGQEGVVELILISMIVGGHILIEGVSGVAKTLLARAASRALAVEFRRVQFTPETTGEDLIGSWFESQLGRTFRPGPIFTNILLADEINRTPSRTQAALLEAMQERQVSLAQETRTLPEPFMVMATQNPSSFEGTFPLPEAQLDRFLFKVSVSYVSEPEEVNAMLMKHEGIQSATLFDVFAAISLADLVEAKSLVDSTDASEEVIRYMVSVIRLTRELPTVSLGASTRAAVHLLGASKAAARIAGRDHVTIEDIQRMVPPVLRHRLMLRREVAFDEYTADDALKFVLETVPVPERV
jgi:MoxR-like ATPase